MNNNHARLEADSNPFVPLPAALVYVLLIFIFIYKGVGPGFRTFFVEQEVPYAGVMFALDLVYNVLLFLPLYFAKDRFGVLHPLIFPALFKLVDFLGRNPFEFFLIFDNSAFYHPISERNAILSDYSSYAISEFILQIKSLEILSLLSIYFGFFLGPRWKSIRVSSKDSRYLVLLCFSLVLFATFVLVVYIAMKGGLTKHFTSFGKGREEAVGGEGPIHVLISFGFIGALIWWAYRPKALSNPLFWVALGLTLPAIFLAKGSRSSIIYSGLLFVLIYIYRIRRLPIISLSIGVVLTIILVAILGEIRKSSFSNKEVNWSVVNETNSFSELLEVYKKDIELRGSRYADIVVMALGKERSGYLLGKTYLGGLLFFVPRFIWKDKPHTAGYYVGNELYGGIGGVPPSSVMEAYWNFDFLGVIFVYALFGTFLNWQADFLKLNHSYPVGLMVFVFLLFYSGPSNNAIVNLAQKLSSLLGVLWLFQLVPPYLVWRRKS